MASHDDTEQMSPEELQQQLLGAVVGMVHALAPEGTPEATAAQMVELAYQQAQRAEFAAAFDALFNPERVAQNARWGVQLTHRAAPDVPHLFHAPKRLGTDPSPADLASFCVAFGLLSSPDLRAVVMTLGYRIEFVDIAQKKAPLIYSPS